MYGAEVSVKGRIRNTKSNDTPSSGIRSPTFEITLVVDCALLSVSGTGLEYFRVDLLLPVPSRGSPPGSGSGVLQCAYVAKGVVAQGK